MSAKRTPNIVATAPERIYLVIGEDVDKSTDFADLCGEGITWCEDKIDGNSIEYVRAALAGNPAPRLTDAEIIAIRKGDRWGKIADPSKPWSDSIAFARAIEAKVRGE